MPSTPPTGESNRTELLPLFPLGTVLVPGMPLSLHVFEPRYRQLVADLLNDRHPTVPVFGVVALRSGWEVGELRHVDRDVHEIGTTARITDVYPHGDGRCDLSAVGERRFVIESVDAGSQPYLVATVRYLSEGEDVIDIRDIAVVRQLWSEHLRVLGVLGGESEVDTDVPAPVGQLSVGAALSYAVARLPSLPLSDRQLLLGCADVTARLAAARRILRRETLLLRHIHAIPAPATIFRDGSSAS
jgi:uncharacterized protein